MLKAFEHHSYSYFSSVLKVDALTYRRVLCMEHVGFAKICAAYVPRKITVINVDGWL